MKILSKKLVVLGLMSALTACSSAPKAKINPMELAGTNTAWTLMGNEELDEAGIALAVAAQGAKVEMMAWFAKNNGCVQYGQFKNEVAAAMYGIAEPTPEQINEAEANALAKMSASDRTAFQAHCDTMGDEAGGALVKCAAAIVAAGELKEALKGAKDSITGDPLEKMAKVKLFADGLGRVAELVTFLTNSQEVINQWSGSYQEWGDGAQNI